MNDAQRKIHWKKMVLWFNLICLHIAWCCLWAAARLRLILKEFQFGMVADFSRLERSDYIATNNLRTFARMNSLFQFLHTTNTLFSYANQKNINSRLGRNRKRGFRITYFSKHRAQGDAIWFQLSFRRWHWNQSRRTYSSRTRGLFQHEVSLQHSSSRHGRRSD